MKKNITDYWGLILSLLLISLPIIAGICHTLKFLK
jgi:hypothetical protein